MSLETNSVSAASALRPTDFHTRQHGTDTGRNRSLRDEVGLTLDNAMCRTEDPVSVHTGSMRASRPSERRIWRYKRSQSVFTRDLRERYRRKGCVNRLIDQRTR